MPAHDYRPAQYPPRLQHRVGVAVAVSVVALLAVVALVAPWLSGMRASPSTWGVLIAATTAAVTAALWSWRSVLRLAAELSQPAYLPDTVLGPLAGASTPLRLAVPPPTVDADDVLLLIFAALLGACFLGLLLGPLQGTLRLVALILVTLVLAAMASHGYRRHLARRWAAHPDARATIVDSLGWSLPAHLLWPPRKVNAPAVRVPWSALRRLTVAWGGSDSPDTYDLELNEPIIGHERSLSVLRSPFQGREAELLDRLRVGGVSVVVRDELF